MKLRLAVALMISTVAFLAPILLAAQTPAAITITSGQLQGVAVNDGKVIAYKGVPFAAPPVGELRWKAPQPTKPWSGIRKADTFAPSCAQAKNHRLPWTKEFMVQNEVSEDCLYLNVWASANKSASLLPVFVYIHGGGFGEGSGAIDAYNGANLAELGIIVVTINYRLGAMGFMALPELTAESPNHASGNYGLMDQVAALQWIKRNIKAFHGDPDNITICGQSAGAASVQFLVVSPLAKGLFQRAIAESGSSMSGFPMRSLPEAEKAGSDFLAKKGVTTLAAARALPWSEFNFDGMPGAGPYGTDVDGYFLQQNVLDSFAANKFSDVPYLTGATSEDSAGWGPPVAADQYLDYVQQRYKEMASQFLELYPARTDEEVKLALLRSGQDRSRVSTYLFVQQRSKTAKTPAYIYYFDRATPWPEHPEFGAFHTSDIPYMMRNLKRVDHPYAADDYKVSDVMSRYWVNFIKSGNPGGNDLPQWDAVSGKSKQTQEIGVHTGAMPLADPAKLAFWLDYFASPLGKNAPMF